MGKDLAGVLGGQVKIVGRTGKIPGRLQEQGEPPPSFGTRLVVLHGGAATVTFALAALTALVLSR